MLRSYLVSALFDGGREKKESLTEKIFVLFCLFPGFFHTSAHYIFQDPKSVCSALGLCQGFKDLVDHHEKKPELHRVPISKVILIFQPFGPRLFQTALCCAFVVIIQNFFAFKSLWSSQKPHPTFFFSQTPVATCAKIAKLSSVTLQQWSTAKRLRYSCCHRIVPLLYLIGAGNKRFGFSGGTETAVVAVTLCSSHSVCVNLSWYQNPRVHWRKRIQNCLRVGWLFGPGVSHSCEVICATATKSQKQAAKSSFW